MMRQAFRDITDFVASISCSVMVFVCMYRYFAELPLTPGFTYFAITLALCNPGRLSKHNDEGQSA